MSFLHREKHSSTETSSNMKAGVSTPAGHIEGVQPISGIAQPVQAAPIAGASLAQSSSFNQTAALDSSAKFKQVCCNQVTIRVHSLF